MKTLYLRIAQLLVVMAIFIPAFDFGVGDIKDEIIKEVLDEIPDFGLGSHGYGEAHSLD